MMQLRSLLAAALITVLILPAIGLAELPRVEVLRLPEGGVQPRAVIGQDGTIHVVFLRGERLKSDVFYMRSTDGGQSFEQPVRVNSEPGTAMIAGAVRGADLALGREGFVHVVWMGSLPSGGAPQVIYARGKDGQFSNEQLLRGTTAHIDGGPSIAADGDGRVYAVWHANARGADSEADRRVWVSRSQDDGAEFASPTPVDDKRAGACACCGLRAFCGPDGELLILYRTAAEQVNRDMVLLRSTDAGRSFTEQIVGPLKIARCVMSNAAFASRENALLAAWESEDSVWFAPIGADGIAGKAFHPRGGDTGQKHPTIAIGADGNVLLAWADGTGWNKGGSVRWALFDRNTTQIGGGHVRHLPPLDFPAAVALPAGGFVVIF